MADTNNVVRIEVRDVTVRVAAPMFQLLLNSTFGTGMGVPHPQILVKRKGEQIWRKLDADQRRKFWLHAQ